MTRRRGPLWCFILCLGCQTLPSLSVDSDGSTAGQLWEKGQAAMRAGQVDEAIRCYQESLAADPDWSRSHLSLAAAYLEKREPEAACDHMGKYVESHPDQLFMRPRYAELLVRTKRLQEARAQFELFIAGAQEQDGPEADQMISCHSRLVELAQEAQDEYQEHLHRGIGLVLLGRKRASLPAEGDDLATDSFLFKAAAELTLAHAARPEQARPEWYLYQVWSMLGQQHPARLHIRQALALEPGTYLTAAEQRGLHLAELTHHLETTRGR